MKSCTNQEINDKRKEIIVLQNTFMLLVDTANNAIGYY